MNNFMKNYNQIKKFFKEKFNRKKVVKLDLSAPVITVDFFEGTSLKNAYDKCVELSIKNQSHIKVFIQGVDLIINYQTDYEQFKTAFDKRRNELEREASKRYTQEVINRTLKNAAPKAKDKEDFNPRMQEKFLKFSTAADFTKLMLQSHMYNSSGLDIIENFDENRAVIIAGKMANQIYEANPVYRDELSEFIDEMNFDI